MPDTILSTEDVTVKERKREEENTKILASSRGLAFYWGVSLW